MSKASEWVKASQDRPRMICAGLTFSVSEKGNLSVEGQTPATISNLIACDVGRWILDTFSEGDSFSEGESHA